MGAHGCCQHSERSLVQQALPPSLLPRFPPRLHSRPAAAACFPVLHAPALPLLARHAPGPSPYTWSSIMSGVANTGLSSTDARRRRNCLYSTPACAPGTPGISSCKGHRRSGCPLLSGGVLWAARGFTAAAGHAAGLLPVAGQRRQLRRACQPANCQPRPPNPTEANPHLVPLRHLDPHAAALLAAQLLRHAVRVQAAHAAAVHVEQLRGGGWRWGAGSLDQAAPKGMAACAGHKDLAAAGMTTVVARVRRAARHRGRAHLIARLDAGLLRRGALDGRQHHHAPAGGVAGDQHAHALQLAVVADAELLVVPVPRGVGGGGPKV